MTPAAPGRASANRRAPRAGWMPAGRPARGPPRSSPAGAAGGPPRRPRRTRPAGPRRAPRRAARRPRWALPAGSGSPRTAARCGSRTSRRPRPSPRSTAQERAVAPQPGGGELCVRGRRGIEQRVRGSPAEPTRSGTFGRGRPREAWRTLRTPRCRQNPRTTRPASAVRPDPHHQSQGSPPPHVRHPQRPPPQDPRRADRSWPRDRGRRRRGDARGPPGPARGGRQLQGGQGLRRAGARAGGRARRSSRASPPASRSSRSSTRSSPRSCPRATGPSALVGNPAVIALVGLQGSGKTTSAAKLAKHIVKLGRRAAPRRRGPVPAGRRGPARDAGQEPRHRRLPRPGRDPHRGHRPAGHRAREAHRPRHGDHRHGRPPHDRRRAHGGDPRGRRRRPGPSRRCSSWTR